MDGVEESAISRAVRADAEAARSEIRAAGISCPSCGANMADLPWDHSLVLDGGVLGTAKCASGDVVKLAGAGYEAVKAALNVKFWDDVNASMDEEFSRMTGRDIRSDARPEPHFTGLLDILGDD